MEKLKLYIVTKSNSDESIKKGDLIWLSENGDLNNAMAGGWLSEDEWNQNGVNDFNFEISKTHYLDVIDGRETIREIEKSNKFLEEFNRNVVQDDFLKECKKAGDLFKNKKVMNLEETIQSIENEDDEYLSASTYRKSQMRNWLSVLKEYIEKDTAMQVKNICLAGNQICPKCGERMSIAVKNYCDVCGQRIK